MKNRPYYVVDAFAIEPFTGNPAAVVLDAEALDDGQMLRIAGEFNLSETTFVLPPNDPAADVRFRWFTPGLEVAMCGHATLAGVHALFEAGRRAHPAPGHSAQLRIQTKSGILTAFFEPSLTGAGMPMIWLEMPRPVLTPSPIRGSDLAGALGMPDDAFDLHLPCVRTQDDDLLLFARDFQAVHNARPDFRSLGQLLNQNHMRGVSLATVHTITPSLHVQSRFFAPAAGVDEDPVTGSVHGPLASYLVHQDLAPRDGDTAALSCAQAKPGGRGGLLHALVTVRPDSSHQVRIGGRTVGSMQGQLVA